jgi:urease accessory protein
MLLPNLALAHSGTGGGLMHGVLHPFTGLDHLFAMIAVGLWAAQLGGRATWLVPLTFVVVMAVGGMLGMAGISLPFAEAGIVASLLVLGVLIAAWVRLPLIASMTLVGIFALFHGFAHGVEMPEGTSGYMPGFMLSTVVLHLTGIGIQICLDRVGYVTRLVGVSVSLFGGMLCFAG